MSLPHTDDRCEPCPCGRAHEPIADDPSGPSDPTWAELGEQLREAGLGWEELGRDWLPTAGAEAAWRAWPPGRALDALWAETVAGGGGGLGLELGPCPEDRDLTQPFLRGVQAERDAAAERGGAR